MTIEAGTVIKGISVSSGEKAASLIIEPGAKIMAEGTVDKPIVFTSDKEPGKRATGDWGGLIICGNARVNQTSSHVFLSSLHMVTRPPMNLMVKALVS